MRSMAGTADETRRSPESMLVIEWSGARMLAGTRAQPLGPDAWPVLRMLAARLGTGGGGLRVTEPRLVSGVETWAGSIGLDRPPEAWDFTAEAVEPEVLTLESRASQTAVEEEVRTPRPGLFAERRPALPSARPAPRRPGPGRTATVQGIAGGTGDAGAQEARAGTPQASVPATVPARPVRPAPAARRTMTGRGAGAIGGVRPARPGALPMIRTLLPARDAGQTPPATPGIPPEDARRMPTGPAGDLLSALRLRPPAPAAQRPAGGLLSVMDLPAVATAGTRAPKMAARPVPAGVGIPAPGRGTGPAPRPPRGTAAAGASAPTAGIEPGVQDVPGTATPIGAPSSPIEPTRPEAVPAFGTTLLSRPGGAMGSAGAPRPSGTATVAATTPGSPAGPGLSAGWQAATPAPRAGSTILVPMGPAFLRLAAVLGRPEGPAPEAGSLAMGALDEAALLDLAPAAPVLPPEVPVAGPDRAAPGRKGAARTGRVVAAAAPRAETPLPALPRTPRAPLPVLPQRQIGAAPAGTGPLPSHPAPAAPFPVASSSATPRPGAHVPGVVARLPRAAGSLTLAVATAPARIGQASGRPFPPAMPGFVPLTGGARDEELLRAAFTDLGPGDREFLSLAARPQAGEAPVPGAPFGRPRTTSRDAGPAPVLPHRSGTMPARPPAGTPPLRPGTPVASRAIDTRETGLPPSRNSAPEGTAAATTTGPGGSGRVAAAGPLPSASLAASMLAPMGTVLARTTSPERLRDTVQAIDPYANLALPAPETGTTWFLPEEETTLLDLAPTTAETAVATPVAQGGRRTPAGRRGTDTSAGPTAGTARAQARAPARTTPDASRLLAATPVSRRAVPLASLARAGMRAADVPMTLANLGLQPGPLHRPAAARHPAFAPGVPGQGILVAAPHGAAPAGPAAVPLPSPPVVPAFAAGLPPVLDLDVVGLRTPLVSAFHWDLAAPVGASAESMAALQRTLVRALGSLPPAVPGSPGAGAPATPGGGATGVADLVEWIRTRTPGRAPAAGAPTASASRGPSSPGQPPSRDAVETSPELDLVELGTDRVSGPVRPEAVRGTLPGLPDLPGAPGPQIDVSLPDRGLVRPGGISSMLSSLGVPVPSVPAGPTYHGSYPLVSTALSSVAATALASGTGEQPRGQAQSASQGQAGTGDKSEAAAGQSVDLEGLAAEMTERILRRLKRDKERRGFYG